MGVVTPEREIARRALLLVLGRRLIETGDVDKGMECFNIALQGAWPSLGRS